VRAIKHWICLSILGASLTSCADTLNERQGIAVDVLPLKHSYSVEVKEDITVAYAEIDRYIDENWNKLSSAPMELVAHSEQGEKIALHVKAYLRLKGKDWRLLTDSTGNGQGDFDFSLISTHHQVVTPICDYYQIGYFGETAHGCYTEGARMQSIVYPEKLVK
jgi:hypothetical protein